MRPRIPWLAFSALALGALAVALPVVGAPRWVGLVILAALPVAVVANAWPIVRQWGIYHFPGARDQDSGPLALTVTYDRAYLRSYDAEQELGGVVVEGLRIRNRRRQALELNLKLVFYPYDPYDDGRRTGVATRRDGGPERIRLEKRGRISIPVLSAVAGPIAPARDYVQGTAKLVIFEDHHRRELHVHLFE